MRLAKFILIFCFGVVIIITLSYIKIHETVPRIFILTRNAATVLSPSKNKTVIVRSSPKKKTASIKLPPVWIYAITPTYTRWTQKAELVRLSQTLQHVSHFHWIIVEDSVNRTDLVKRLLKASGLTFTHLNVRTPPDQQRQPGEKYNAHHRGVSQRNLALQWLRDNVNYRKTPGVVCFMDDDNTYHLQIFEEMRKTRRVSVFGVGFAGKQKWAGPLVKNGKVVGFHTNWAPKRQFPIDMAGFAVSLEYLLTDKKHVFFNSTVKSGWLETTFMSDLVPSIDKLEPLASNPTKIYVWHTRTEIPIRQMNAEIILAKKGKGSDPSIEV